MKMLPTRTLKNHRSSLNGEGFGRVSTSFKGDPNESERTEGFWKRVDMKDLAVTSNIFLD